MNTHEQLLRAGMSAVVEKHGDDVELLLGSPLQVPSTPFPRVSLAEARKMIAADGYLISRSDGDLDPEGERRLSNIIRSGTGSEFVFVTDYEAGLRPFYHMRHEEEPGLSKSYDLLYAGMEVATGAQREHRIEILEKQAVEQGLSLADLSPYFDFFRYGMPRHGGFGMGLARIMTLMFRNESIKNSTFLFRGPTRLFP